MMTRLFTMEDLHVCVQLFVDVFNRPPWNDQWSISQATDYFLDVVHTPGFYGFVVEQNETIDGFVLGTRKKWWSGSIYYLYEMCVRPNVQGRGVGSKLVNDMKHWLRQHQFTAIVLLTERTLPSATFYMKQGFIESPNTRFYLCNL